MLGIWRKFHTNNKFHILLLVFFILFINHQRIIKKIYIIDNKVKVKRYQLSNDSGDEKLKKKLHHSRNFLINP